MDPLIVTQAINVLYGVSTLAVLALGLAVIFGLLGVLNIAHGEFVMIGAYCAYVDASGRLALSRRRAVDACGLRRPRRGGRVDHDPSALPPAVRHAGGDLGLEPAAAQDRRSDLRPRLSQREHSVAGHGQVPRHRISDLPAAADRDFDRGRCCAGRLVWPQPHRQPHPRHGEQSGACAGAGHIRALARCRHLRHRHLPCRAWRRDDRAARAGAAFHGPRLRAARILCADRRRARQRCRLVVGRDRRSAASTA